MNPSNESSGPDDLDLTGVRILVVEDSWQLGMAFTSLLKALGAEVLGPVATSVDAQRLACEEPPHAALVDFNLRGGELAGALIEQLQEQGIYVVVIFHGEAKTWHGLSRAVRRGLANMKIQAYLTAAAINLKRLAAALLRFFYARCFPLQPFAVSDRAGLPALT